MLVTVSGPPGSGKSTAAAGLAEACSLEHVSGGDLFRGLAADRGMSLAEFGALAESDDSIDRTLDEELRTTAIEDDGLVLESRLAGWMAGDHADLRVWLDAPIDVRARRIAKREGFGVDVARIDTLEREASERRRYLEYYDIDVTDRSIYDLAINTARWDAETVLGLLVDAVGCYDPASDEGKVPIEGVRYAFE